MLGKAEIIQGDARSLALPDSTVDLVVTSPPYLNLRAYQDAGQAYDGQIGAEESRESFIDSLLEVTRECMRVLKPTGSIFVNLGDSYREKGLQLTPQRYAMRCVDELGLILRAEIVWSKPNGLPESVTDRVRRSHEVWWHFTKSPRYFSAVDEIREEHEHPKALAYNLRNGGPTTGSKHNADRGDAGVSNLGGNPLGRLPGSVWTIPTQPLRVPEHLGIDHFAAFPMEWPRRIIRGWSPSGVCVECGEGRRPVVDRGASFPRDEIGAHRNGKVTTERGDGASVNNTNGQERNAWRAANPHKVTGESCACREPTAPTRPAIVLDPFGGTGTTALVAKALGRHGISNDMSADYCRLAQWRTTDEGELARAMQVDKPAVQVAGQASLLDLLGEESA